MPFVIMICGSAGSVLVVLLWAATGMHSPGGLAGWKAHHTPSHTALRQCLLAAVWALVLFHMVFHPP